MRLSPEINPQNQRLRHGNFSKGPVKAMAKLVAAVGTPHGPMLPQQVADAPGQLRSEALMTQVRNQLEKAEPDLGHLGQPDIPKRQRGLRQLVH